jgi:hypothetical protein
MKLRIAFLLCAAFALSVEGFSQKITYSELQKQDVKNINFEILGKIGDNYVIYKNVRWKHMIQVLNKDMVTIKNDRLDFIPERTFNIDFVTYPDHFYMIYQYEKSNVIYCKAVKLDQSGKTLGEVLTLDTTRLGLLNDNRIYGTAFSEDKQKILVYKMQKKQGDLHIMTKRFNSNLQMMDSVRSIVPFSENRDIYSDMVIANDGTVIYAKQLKSGFRENIDNLEVSILDMDTKRFISQPVNMQDKYIDEVKIKVDNLNNTFLLNTFFYTRRNGSIEGLYSVLLNRAGAVQKTFYNPFSDSLRATISNSGQYRFAFDNLFLRDIFLKKDGSFMLVAEDFYTQNRSALWNRWDYLYNSPFSYNSGYYSPRYGYYRPYNSNWYSGERFYYDNLMIAGFDSNLKADWTNIVHKKQYDEDTGNFVSYATLNSGAEIHFLFIEQERNSQVISNHSISASGKVQRYATIKTRETGYQFMPRLGKQVGIRQIIIPCIYRGAIAFAKIDFAVSQS